MSYRFLACLGALAAMLAAPLPAQAPKSAAKAKSTKIPRTSDGHPDLQGVWTNATITPMERPARFNGKATISDADATAYEKSDAEELQKQDGASDGPLIAAAGSSGTGGYNVLFVDRGTELARGLDGATGFGAVEPRCEDSAGGTHPNLSLECGGKEFEGGGRVGCWKVRVRNVLKT